MGSCYYLLEEIAMNKLPYLGISTDLNSTQIKINDCFRLLLQQNKLF